MTPYMTRPTLLSMMLACAALTACNKPGPAEEAGRKIDKSTEHAAHAVSDADITTKVKMALMMRDGLDSLTISVTTQTGVVTLSGSVASAAQSKLAQQLALAVDDVTSVTNKLSIVSPAQ